MICQEVIIFLLLNKVTLEALPRFSQKHPEFYLNVSIPEISHGLLFFFNC